MNERIKNLSRFQIEFENVKNEFIDLEKEMNEKTTTITELEKDNHELIIRLSESENKVLNLENYGKDLEGKIGNLNQLCGKFENAYNGAVIDLQKKKDDHFQSKKEIDLKDEEIKELKEQFTKQLTILKNENLALKKRESIYKETLSKLKEATNNNSTDNFQNNMVSPLRNNMNQGNPNNSYYTYNPLRNGNELNMSPSPYYDKDDSFKYSYYLIDNLKNAINNVDFQKNLTNI